MTREVAQNIRDLFLECSGKMDQSVQLVKDTCPEDEFREYRSAVAQVMGAIYSEVLMRVFKKHPDLEPDSMKSS